MKRILTLLFAALILLGALAGCSDDNKNTQPPNFDYPGDQDNLNNYNNGLSMSESYMRHCRSCFTPLINKRHKTV